MPPPPDGVVQQAVCRLSEHWPWQTTPISGAGLLECRCDVAVWPTGRVVIAPGPRKRPWGVLYKCSHFVATVNSGNPSCRVFFRGYNMAMAGRPKKPPGKSRLNVLRIRLTDVERQRLDEEASSVGLETSTWARSELLRLTEVRQNQIRKR